MGTEPSATGMPRCGSPTRPSPPQELGWHVADDVATGFRALAGWLREERELWPRYEVERPVLR